MSSTIKLTFSVKYFSKIMPNKIAVTSEFAEINYKDLEAVSDKLAYFCKENGLRIGDRVCIVFGREVNFIVALLGVLKAGCTYIPIDFNLPDNRLKDLLNDVSPSLIITASSFVDKFKGYAIPAVSIEAITSVTSDSQNQSKSFEGEMLFSEVVSHTPAYILFSSGTTGKPKGILISRSNIKAYTASIIEALTIPNGKSFAHVSALTADLGNTMIFTSLATGGTLHILSERMCFDPEKFMNYISSNHIDFLKIVPSHLSTLLSYSQSDKFLPIDTLILGGETTPWDLVSKISSLKPSLRIVNHYGPTETTIGALYYIYNPSSTHNTESNSLPIGKALPFAKVKLLDEEYKEISSGKIGQIFIGGEGVGYGYLNNPELSAKKYLYNIFNDNSNVFCTGDRARLLQDGNIEFIGRSDDQVKISGFLVELADIKMNCKKIREIKDVEILEYNNNLYAFIVLSETALSEEFIRERLKLYLPFYMIPLKIFFVEEINLSDNGKVNRTYYREFLLNSICKSNDLNNSAYFLEDKIRNIWHQLLNKYPSSNFVNFSDEGGHSLLLIQMVVKLKQEFQVNVKLAEVLDHQTIELLCNLLRNKLASITHPTNFNDNLWTVSSDIANKFVPFPLNEVQRAYILGRSAELELGGVSVHGYSEYRLININIPILEQAFNKLIQRHDSLRLKFNDDFTQQVIEQASYYNFIIFDCTNLSKEKLGQHFEKMRLELSHQIFELGTWPMFAIYISQVKEDEYILHLSRDILILDAWSVGIILKEWTALYKDISLTLPELKISFRDYVIAEEKIKSTETYKNSKNYWLSRIESFPIERPNLPTKKNSEARGPNIFKRVTKTISLDKWLKIKNIAKSCSISSTNLLLCLYADIIASWSNSYHFAINITLFGRIPFHKDVNNITGDFTTLNLLEVDFRDFSMDFAAKAKMLQDLLIDDLDNRFFSGIEFAREIRKYYQHQELSALYPIVFTCILGNDSEASREDNITSSSFTSFIGEQVYGISQTPQVWLDFKAYETPNGLTIEWDFSTNIFKDKTILDMHSIYYEKLLSIEKTGGLAYLSPPYLNNEMIKKHQEYNNTSKIFNLNHYNVLHEGFFSQANIQPNNIAVFFKNEQYTYFDLKNKVYSIIRELQECGIRQGDFVAIIVGRGINHISSALACSSLGAIFVPIEPSTPIERIDGITIKSKVKAALIENNSTHLTLNTKIVINLDILSTQIYGEINQIPISQRSLAYVIFTSGSTGVPKGVMMTHKAAQNTINDINQRFNISKDDKILALSHLSFDLAIYDLFGLLGAGGSLIIPEDLNYKNPEFLLTLIQNQKVTIWNSVPMLLQILIEYCANDPNIILPIDNSLRLVFISGDKIPVNLIEKIRNTLGNKIRIISLGGATEGGIWSIYYDTKNLKPDALRIPYGYPLSNQQFYVLNKDFTWSPDCVKGDLYIGGESLASGYLADDTQTQKRFINPKPNLPLLYSTGDIGFFNEEGYIEILGRDDSQVKLSSYRVELEEIVISLCQNNQVKDAATTVEQDLNLEKKVLTAYILPKNLNLSVENGQKQYIVPEKLDMPELYFVSSVKDYVDKEISSNNYIDAIYQIKSYRSFFGKKISLDKLETFLFEKEATKQSKEYRDEDFLKEILVACSAVTTQDNPYPKYSYPSAGNFYSVKVIVEITKDFQDFKKGVYIWEPISHKLFRFSDTEKASKATRNFSVRLAVDDKALKLKYGNKAKEFYLLECGYILSVIQSRLSTRNYQISFDYYTKNDAFELAYNGTLVNISHLVEINYSNIKNIVAGQNHENELITYLIFKDSNDRQNLYKLTATGLDIVCEIPNGLTILFDENKDIESQMNLVILWAGGGPSIDHSYINSGFAAQNLIFKLLKNKIGLCAIGSIRPEFNDFLISKTGLEQNYLHLLVGGPISRAQLREHTSKPTNSFVDYIKNIKAYMVDTLPAYMIPTRWHIVNSIPITTNGKVDFRSLNKYVIYSDITTQNNVNIELDVDTILIEIWTEVLGKRPISSNDNLFLSGGDSLSIIRLMNKVRDRLSLKIDLGQIFINPTLKALDKIVKSSSRDNLDRLVDVNLSYNQGFLVNKDFANLTSSQYRLWFIDQFNIKKNLYNMSVRFDIVGDLNKDILHFAFEELIKRHEVFRSRIGSFEGEPFAKIAREFDFNISFFDFTNSDQKAIDEFSYQEAAQEIDLTKILLPRIKLLQTSEKSYVLLMTVHHIICDAWSMDIIVRDLSELYNSRVSGTQPLLPHKSFDYYDFAYWQKTYLTNPSITTQIQYWKNKLDNINALNSFITDFKRPVELTSNGEVYYFKLTADKLLKVKNFSNKMGITLYMFLLGAYFLLLKKYSVTNQIIIGSPVANRHYKGVEEIVGFFSNSVPLLLNIDCSQELSNFFRAVNLVVLEAFNNQDVPFDKIVDEIGIERSLSYHPIFQFWFVMRNAGGAKLSIKDVTSTYKLLNNRISKFDLLLSAREVNAELELDIQYSTDLFKRSRIQLLSSEFISMIDKIIEGDTKSKISDFIYYYDQVSSKFLQNSLDAKKVVKTNKLNIIEKLQELSQSHPSQDALIFEDMHISYNDLNDRRLSLASYLVQQGVQKGDVIGVFLERDPSYIYSALAIFSIGATYLPLDINTPNIRLQEILNSSEVKYIICNKTHKDKLIDYQNYVKVIEYVPDTRLIKNVELDLSFNDFKENIAYIIYTSGSSGKPKGVKISYKSINNYIISLSGCVEIKKELTYLHTAAFTFSSSLRQMLLPIISGGTIVLTSDQQRKSFEEFVNLVTHREINILDIIPSFFNGLIEYLNIEYNSNNKIKRVFIQNIKIILFASELLPIIYIKKWLELIHSINSTKNDIQLINMYGQTELSGIITFDKINLNILDTDEDYMPIGRPIGNAMLRIISDDYQVLPAGIPGELVVLQSNTLATEYVFSQALNYIPDFYDPLSKLTLKAYKTGDIAKLSHSGNIYILGRKDRQVKIKGFRINLDEIEIVLKEYNNIVDAAVKCSNNFLIAYIVTQDSVDLSDIKNFLSKRLTNYMMPSSIFTIDKIPRLISGKVNFHALEQLEQPQEIKESQHAVLTENQSIILEIWEEVLFKKNITIDDNFFEIGGDSILSLQVVSKARKRNLFLTINDIFLRPTIRQITSNLNPSVVLDNFEENPDMEYGNLILHPIQRNFFDQKYYNVNYWNQSILLDCSQKINKDVLEKALYYLHLAHSALRTRFYLDNNIHLQSIKSRNILQKDNVEVINISCFEDPNFITICEKMQSSLNIFNGPLIKFIIFSDGRLNKLFVISHHLIMDGVSLRILIEDINQIYQKLSGNLLANVEFKNSSVPAWYWSKRKLEYFKKSELLSEKFYWLSVIEKGKKFRLPINISNHISHNLVGDSEKLFINLTKEQTSKILNWCAKEAKIKFDQLLLATLVISLEELTSSRSIYTYLEGHGRDDISLDITRTIGWFTTLYPFYFEAKDCNSSLFEILLDIALELSLIPKNGENFGWFKYYDENFIIPEDTTLPNIIFNYLGIFDSSSSSTFKLSDIPFGENVSKENHRQVSLYFYSLVKDGRFTLSIRYPKALYTSQIIENISTKIIKQLRFVIDEIDNKNHSHILKYPLARLEKQELDEILFNYPSLQDIYLLSPMQGGMIFNSLLKDQEGEYVTQRTYKINGILNIAKFQQAWEFVLAKHDILRTCFVFENLNVPHQIVIKQLELPLTFIDIRHFSDKNTYISDFLASDRTNPFKLNTPPLLRLYLFHLNEEEYVFILVTHHILVDGWCESIIINDFIQFYQDSTKILFKNKNDYKAYIKWLSERDLNHAKHFWQKYLEDAILPSKVNSIVGENNYYITKLALGIEVTNALQQMANNFAVTLNNIIQGIWAIILMIKDGKTSSIFGVTFSGRAIDIENIEQIVGLFINTVPLKINIDSDFMVKEFFQKIFNDMIEINEHHHYPLSQLGPKNRRKNKLFDSILVFENYDSIDQELNLVDNLILTKESTIWQTEYPLTLVVIPGDNLTLKFGYNTAFYSHEEIDKFKSDIIMIINIVLREGPQLSIYSLVQSDKKDNIKSYEYI